CKEKVLAVESIEKAPLPTLVPPAPTPVPSALEERIREQAAKATRDALAYFHGTWRCSGTFGGKPARVTEAFEPALGGHWYTVDVRGTREGGPTERVHGFWGY